MRKNQGGFTLIEILMVVMLVAIMAVVAIPQYLDFQQKAKDEATRGVLGAFRTGIQNMKALRIVKCGAPASQYPALATIANNYLSVANDTAGECDAGEIAALNAGDVMVVSGSGNLNDIPDNPAGTASTVTECAAACTATPGSRTACTGGPTGGWCYDTESGNFWSDVAGTYEF